MNKCLISVVTVFVLSISSIANAQFFWGCPACQQCQPCRQCGCQKSNCAPCKTKECAVEKTVEAATVKEPTKVNKQYKYVYKYRPLGPFGLIQVCEPVLVEVKEDIIPEVPAETTEVIPEASTEEAVDSGFPTKSGTEECIDFPPIEEESIPLMTLELPLECADQEVCNCFNKINECRNRFGLPALRMDEAMCKIAQNHCNHMAQWGSMFHSGCGYCENVAWGNTSGQRTFNQWHRSPGHFQNMTRQGTKCGIARNGAFWTFIIGR